MVNNWPWPEQCPPKPWTPEQQKKYQEEQRGKIPAAPMIVSFV